VLEEDEEINPRYNSSPLIMFQESQEEIFREVNTLIYISTIRIRLMLNISPFRIKKLFSAAFDRNIFYQNLVKSSNINIVNNKQ
jgi:hypothetical protein